MEVARKKREKRLRAKLLLVLQVTSRTAPTGFISARLLVDQADGLMGPKQGFDDDAHALGLIRDLVRAGFAEEKPLGERRRGQSFGVDFLQCGITDKGGQLAEQLIPPHPLVDDDRQVEE